MAKEKGYDQVMKDAQFRKTFSIAFFNATNAGIALASAKASQLSIEEMRSLAVDYRDFFLEEHKKYWAEVIAKVGVNYSVEEAITKLQATNSQAELNKVWVALSADERHDEAIAKVAQDLQAKYKNEKN